MKQIQLPNKDFKITFKSNKERNKVITELGKCGFKKKEYSSKNGYMFLSTHNNEFIYTWDNQKVYEESEATAISYNELIKLCKTNV